MDGAKEVAGGLVAAGGNAAILLELVEELLNQMMRPVQVLVVATRLLAAALGRNHDVFASVEQQIDDLFVGIVSFVCNDRSRLRAGQ